MKKINIHLYPSTGEFETRIFKSMEAATKSNRFEDVIFFTLGNKKLFLKNISVLNVSNSFSKILYVLSSIFFLFKLKPSVINVHNWYCLLSTIPFKFFFETKVIYEPHEVEFGTSYASGYRKYFIYLVEFISFKFFIDQVIFVGEAVKKEYADKYKKNILIKDSFIFYSLPNYKVKSNKIDNKQSAAYLGLFTNGRSIFKLIDI